MKKFLDLIDVKSIVTLTMTLGMILLLTGVFNPPEGVFALYSAAYSSIITYFFTKKKSGSEESGDA